MASPSNLRKDDELWFEDGNLIIVAGGVEFRVYKGPLLLHSEVIRDMVSMPLPSSLDSTESVDGAVPSGPETVLAWVPVHSVQFHDPPGDVRHFLRAFTPGKQLRIGAVHPSFEEVSACIRLGDKYQCKGLVEVYIDYLMQYYPSGLTAEPLGPNVQLVSNPLRYPLTPPAFELKHTIGVVNIIRDLERKGLDQELDVKGLLPVAFARCMMLGSQVATGFDRSDGGREKLSREDLGRVFVGQANLMRSYYQALKRILDVQFDPHWPRPNGPSDCAEVLKQLDHTLPDLKTGILDPTQLVYMLCEDLKQQAVGPKRMKLCDDCYVWVLGRAREEQERLFRGLPTMLGLVEEGLQR
ncbi:hypothetical protein C8Q70DRAFT_922059 [Cubamyces menziesii]|nr:hypothetical protein C8Q70DRAFT_922059 [Cubamyces menziesii]